VRKNGGIIQNFNKKVRQIIQREVIFKTLFS
jgi:hypothetical protein